MYKFISKYIHVVKQNCDFIVNICINYMHSYNELTGTKFCTY